MSQQQALHWKRETELGGRKLILSSFVWKAILAKKQCQFALEEQRACRFYRFYSLLCNERSLEIVPQAWNIRYIFFKIAIDICWQLGVTSSAGKRATAQWVYKKCKNIPITPLQIWSPRTEGVKFPLTSYLLFHSPRHTLIQLNLFH